MLEMGLYAWFVFLDIVLVSLALRDIAHFNSFFINKTELLSFLL